MTGIDARLSPSAHGRDEPITDTHSQRHSAYAHATSGSVTGR